MKSERLFRILGLIDDTLIEETETKISQRKRYKIRTVGLVAACLLLIGSLGFTWLATGGFQGFRAGMDAASGSNTGDNTSGSGYEDENNDDETFIIGGAPEALNEPTGSEPTEGVSSDGGSGIENGTVFMSYAGPVFPLISEANTNLTAERAMTLDFASGSYEDGTPRQWGVQIKDNYIIQNPTDQEIQIQALYPFAGNIRELDEQRPVIKMGETTLSGDLYAGSYSGGFQSTYGAVIPDTMNLENLNSWEQYRALLSDGSYQVQALEAAPALNIPVTVYEFSNFSKPLKDYPAATQAVTFENIHSQDTQIFSYGFEGFSQDPDRGVYQYSYFVPDGTRRSKNFKLLIVLGKDVGNYQLQGYQNGGCQSGEEINGVSCTVTRTASTLDAVLNRLCKDYAESYPDELPDASTGFSLDLFQDAISELLTQYGLLSDAPKDRYNDGRLDDIISETLVQDRVFYLRFPVTIPAGKNIAISIKSQKEPSYDFACSGSENVGLQGYDLITQLDSKLKFTRQTAALENIDGIKIMKQNFGFDIQKNILEVLLDPAQEHYYLEVKPVK